MYNVFLVDDEELVIKSLIASVDWQAFGFNVAGYALSGSEAFEVIRREEPHLVFTDIRMPGMNGLELIKALKDASSPSLIVVLSGYAEFALAQKAINYGAFGYCLKPFDDIEISGFLRKAAALLKNQEPVAKDIDILEYLESDSAENERKLREVLLSSGIDPDGGQGMMVTVSLCKSRLRHEGLQRGIAVRIGMRKYAYLLQENGSLREALEGYETAETGCKGLGVSRTIWSLTDIRQAIQESERQAYRYFTARSGTVSLTSQEAMTTRREALKAFEEAIGKKDAAEIGTCLDDVGSLFANGLMDIEDALTLYNQTLGFVNREQDQLREEYIYSFDQLTESFAFVQVMLDQLKDMLAMTRKPLGTVQTRNRSFRAIMEYVDEHYREELSIQVLSEQFNVNANYISQLFRKEAGTTFTQYLTELRVDYACRLLNETDYPINEIAEQSGYSDYFYFSRIFKRITGTTPSSYRASRLH